MCRCLAPPLAFVVAAGEFSDPLRAAIHSLKYRGQTAGAPALADLLRPGLAGIMQQDHLVVPVPLHPRRRRERGYNQAELLARALVEGEPDRLAVQALRRVKHTRPQVGMSAAQRAHNMVEAFAAEPALCRGRHILLIDDVSTTGATLQAAARATRAAGACKTYAAVLADATLGRDR